MKFIEMGASSLSALFFKDASRGYASLAEAARQAKRTPQQNNRKPV